MEKTLQEVGLNLQFEDEEVGQEGERDAAC